MSVEQEKNNAAIGKQKMIKILFIARLELIHAAIIRINFVSNKFFPFYFKFFNYSSSTKNTATWRIPEAPMTKVCSMSVLRLGPVMMVNCEGLFLAYLRFTV